MAAKRATKRPSTKVKAAAKKAAAKPTRSRVQKKSPSAKPPSPAKRGPKTIMTDNMKAQIIELMFAGKTLTEICADKSMPNRATVQRAVLRDEVFAADLMRAREATADFLVDEAMEIAEDQSRDFYTTPDGDRPSNVAVARDKLRVDTRLRLASVLNPKYSERHRLDVNPDDDSATDEELSNLLVQALAGALVKPSE